MGIKRLDAGHRKPIGKRLIRVLAVCSLFLLYMHMYDAAHHRNCADIVVRHERGIRGPFINHDYDPFERMLKMMEHDDDYDGDILQRSAEQQQPLHSFKDDHITFHSL